MTLLFESDTIQVVDFGGNRFVATRGKNGLMQGGMKHGSPSAAAPCEYLERMIETLWINRPREILILGLGGGTLVKAALEICPQARITVIEKDHSMVRAAIQYFDVPDDHPRLLIIKGEAEKELQRFDRGTFNLILCDVADDNGSLEVFFSARAIKFLRTLLLPRGLLCMNFYRPKHRITSFDILPSEWSHVETEDLKSGNKIFRLYVS